MPKIVIELSENDIYALSRDAKDGYDNPIDNVMLAVKNGTPLEDIMAHLQLMADDVWNQQVGASKGLEEAIEIIESFTERRNDD